MPTAEMWRKQKLPLPNRRKNNIDMKTIFATLSICVLSAPLTAAEGALPLVVEPPVSQGVNEGFSREPNPPTYHKKERILVTEQISATKRHSTHGNNRMFIITEYGFSPDGKKMQITRRAVFEGTARLANEEDFQLNSSEPNVFRMDMGDSAFRIYKARFTPEGDLESLIIYDYDGRTPAEAKGRYIYSNKGLQPDM